MHTRSTAIYPHPFSAAYWRDAAAELKDVRMLMVIALLTALRIALKPLAIPLGPQLSVPTAMLATALGAMIYGPVAAIPAAIISDTVGFLLFPSGDYFLPFVLTEIAGTVIFALFLYRAKPSALRVVLARFFICLLVNVVLQQFIFAWQYTYLGNPEKAKDSVLGILTTARILKNVCMFPIESVAVSLFLGLLLPVTRRAGLTFSDASIRFTRRQIAALVCLTVIGVGSAFGYLAYRYNTTSRSADYTVSERMRENRDATQAVLEKTDLWDGETVVCIVDSAYRPLFGKQTDYTASVYLLDEEAFEAGVAAEREKGKVYDMDTLWAYSKSGPGKDAYGSLRKVGSATLTREKKTGEVLSFSLAPTE